MGQLNVNTVFNIDLQFTSAPVHFRLAAWLIDVIILCLYWFGMAYFIEKVFDFEVANELGLVQLFLVTPMLMYHLIFELFVHGQSPGKMLLGIKVVSLTGQQATVSQYMLRWLTRFVDFGFLWGFLLLVSSDTLLGIILLIGSLISFIHFVSSALNQRLGDKVAGTAIVLKKAPYKLSDTIFQELDLNNYKVHFPSVMRLNDKDLNLVHNIMQQHRKSSMDNYISNVADRIKFVLKIESDMPDDYFLETLLRDYNYLSRK